MTDEEIAESVASRYRDHSSRAAEIDCCTHCEFKEAVLEALKLARKLGALKGEQ